MALNWARMAYGRGSNLEPIAPSAMSKNTSYEVATVDEGKFTYLTGHQVFVLQKRKGISKGFEPETHYIE